MTRADGLICTDETESQGRTPLPLLALVAKQTTAIWDALSEHKMQFPPAAPGAKPDKSKRVSRHPSLSPGHYSPPR